MITSFEVGAVFKIINEASPALTRILAQVRELNAAIDLAKKNLTEIGKIGGTSVALGGAVQQTQALARAWGSVATNAAAANRAMGGAATAARLPAAAGGAAGAAGRAAGGVGAGGGRAGLGNRLGMGSSGLHIRATGIGFPGGHITGGGAMMAGGGLAAYGVYEAAKTEDAVFQLMYHAGMEYNDANRDKLRKILQESVRTSGYGMHEIGEAATQAVRMFQGVPGGGVDVLPEILRAATTEARLKGTSPKESSEAIVGLAHMTKEYGPEAVAKLAKDFAFLSIANPSSLKSMERAAGYAVPVLQSGMNVDPMQTLLLGTALTRAGITNTKSGTWVREMALRAMPGTAIFESARKADHHDELLRDIGLLDANGKATWLDEKGNPDLLKMMRIAQEGLQNKPWINRAGAERQLFGSQGSGAMSVLSDPAVYGQVKELDRMRQSPEWANRYSTFSQSYINNSTVQQSRTAMGEFNNTMADLGQHVLPAVNGALRDFKAVLEGVQSVLPGGKHGDSKVGTRALEFGTAGALGGLIFGPGGAVVGGLGGAAVGAGVGALQDRAPENAKGVADALREGVMKGIGRDKPIVVNPPQMNLSIDLDGKMLWQGMTESAAPYTGYTTQAPGADGLQQSYPGGHNQTDQ